MSNRKNLKNALSEYFPEENVDSWTVGKSNVDVPTVNTQVVDMRNVNESTREKSNVGSQHVDNSTDSTSTRGQVDESTDEEYEFSLQIKIKRSDILKLENTKGLKSLGSWLLPDLRKKITQFLDYDVENLIGNKVETYIFWNLLVLDFLTRLKESPDKKKFSKKFFL